MRFNIGLANGQVTGNIESDVAPEYSCALPIPPGFLKVFCDWDNQFYYEGASKEEMELFKKSLVPETISMMKARMQLVLMGTSMENVLQVIQNLPKEQLPDTQKALILIKLEYATHLERYSPELESLGKLIFTDEQLDYLFINGNKL
jgi:hypothetical protein